MRHAAWIAAMVATAGCSSPAAPSTNDLDITDVPCVIAKGAATFEGGPGSSVEIQGPPACKRALELFLDSHPDQRIASVIPIGHPPGSDQGPLVSTLPGTQRLLVLHTGKAGPWPRARELGVDRIPCYQDAAGAGGQLCGNALLEYTDHPPIEVWVPITEAADTAGVLVLYRGEPRRRP